MLRTLGRAVRLVLAPEREWALIRAESSNGHAAFRAFVAPLAGLPAASWCIGLFLFGGSVAGHRDGVALSLVEILRGGVVVYAGVLLSILALAAAIFALAPLFDCGRHWPRALRTASYSGAPIFLGGIVLVYPDLAFVLLLAALQGFYLLYGGLRCLLNVKEDRAAEYVALSAVLFSVATTAMGAIGAAAGWL